MLFFSDNGGEASRGADNRPLRDSKASVFEGGIRVPAFIRWPGGLPSGQTSQQVMTVLDVFPTLAEAAGRADIEYQAIGWQEFMVGHRQTLKSRPREDLFFAVEKGAFNTPLFMADGSWSRFKNLQAVRPPISCSTLRPTRTKPPIWQRRIRTLSECWRSGLNSGANCTPAGAFG